MPTDAAYILLERIETLGQISESTEYLMRRSYTDAMRRANEAVATWMHDAGMEVRQDVAGNLIGRYAGQSDDCPTLVLGSHLDTVRNAGKFDGPLGILVALAVVERLHQTGQRLPCAIEVMCFADEEGLRFGATYLGSKAVSGTFDSGLLDLTDHEGITMADALRDFGGDPAVLRADGPKRDDLLAYCEVHIEQGPVLEAHNLPVGVVTGIAGQSRIVVTFTGDAGHAGTVPMDLRRDALCAAAEFVLHVEALARREPGLVATVGQLTVEPGASNVIPGQVVLSLDVRHTDDAVRRHACQMLEEQGAAIGSTRNIRHGWRVLQASAAVPCAPDLSGLLEQAIAERGAPVLRLPSGAGHDAVAMAPIVPVGMLFVRCRGGISHHPGEAVEQADVAVAIDVLERFVHLVASKPFARAQMDTGTEP